MATAWGVSWGVAWGHSWDIGTPVPPPTPAGPGGLGFSRRELEAIYGRIEEIDNRRDFGLALLLLMSDL